MKLWWMHSEALIATLTMYQETEDGTHLEDFARILTTRTHMYVNLYQCTLIISGFPRSWKILEKIAVVESHGKVLEYENFPKSHGIASSHACGSFLVCDCHACCETQS